METTATPMKQTAPNAQPRFSGISHVSLSCRDLEESKTFYSQVMGGDLVHEIAGFVEYNIADIIIGLAEQQDGWTRPEDEYPHYAFYIDGANFELMKNWLATHGVPNYPYRRNKTALIYFRDPSGNLFELYCDTGYENIDFLPPAPRRGGPAIDFRGLNYQWDSARAAFESKQEPARPRFTAFAHASLYCGDLEQAKRFFTQVIGGELIHDVDGFAEVRVAGTIIGLTHSSRPNHRARRGISPLRFFHRAGRFSADGIVAAWEGRHYLRALDARRDQGTFIFPRSGWKPLRDVLPKIERRGDLRARSQTGRQLHDRLRRAELRVARVAAAG
jgi:catechol 2,3-dioxygenase-like lactoylglutathione lyase family enzyme